MLKIITKEQTNKNIGWILDVHSIPYRVDWNGLIESTPDEFGYLRTKEHLDIDESKRLGYMVSKLTFECGVREMGEFTASELRQKANELNSIAEATQKLNDLFKDILMRED